jgi:cation efflux family protein
MSHFRRAVGAAATLNTVITVGEAAAGLYSHSLSLLLDSAHNFSDELALVCLYLAFFLPPYLGRQSQRTANVLNSLGLIILYFEWRHHRAGSHTAPTSRAGSQSRPYLVWSCRRGC